MTDLKFKQITAASGDTDHYPFVAGLDTHGKVWIYFIKDGSYLWHRAPDEGIDGKDIK